MRLIADWELGIAESVVVAQTRNPKNENPGSIFIFNQSIRHPQSGGGLLVPLAVFLLKSLDAARSVNQLLFAGEERMAVRADFHVNFFLGRTRRPGMPAG